MTGISVAAMNRCRKPVQLVRLCLHTTPTGLLAVEMPGASNIWPAISQFLAACEALYGIVLCNGAGHPFVLYGLCLDRVLPRLSLVRTTKGLGHSATSYHGVWRSDVAIRSTIVVVKIYLGVNHCGCWAALEAKARLGEAAAVGGLLHRLKRLEPSSLDRSAPLVGFRSTPAPPLW